MLLQRWEMIDMKLPEEIRVGANEHKAEIIKNLLSHNESLRDVTCANATIKLDCSLSKSILRETLAHELVHAMLHKAGYNEHV